MENLVAETGKKFRSLLDAIENNGIALHSAALGPSVGDDGEKPVHLTALGPCVGDDNPIIDAKT